MPKPVTMTSAVEYLKKHIPTLITPNDSDDDERTPEDGQFRLRRASNTFVDSSKKNPNRSVLHPVLLRKLKQKGFVGI